jgi:hypothetical protein
MVRFGIGENYQYDASKLTIQTRVTRIMPFNKWYGMRGVKHCPGSRLSDQLIDQRLDRAAVQKRW